MQVCQAMLANLRARSWVAWPSPETLGFMIFMSFMILLVAVTANTAPCDDKEKCPRRIELSDVLAIIAGVVIAVVLMVSPTRDLRKRIEAFMISHEAMSQKQYDTTIAKLVEDFMKS